MLIHRNGLFRCYRNVINPPCDCMQCHQQLRSTYWQGRKLNTYTEALSDSEAQSKATAFLETTSRHIQYLRNQYSRNGDTILKRWKKSSKKRSSYLLSVEPDLYPYECPNGHLLQNFAEKHLASKARGEVDSDISQGSVRLGFRNACLLSYLNLEALSNDPAKFLNLLYNRSHYTPEQWASYDNYLLIKEWEIASINTVYNGNCIVMHGEDFGKLTPWNEQGAHDWTTIGFPRAILVLEAQAKLLSFLQAVVEKLVEGQERVEMSSNCKNFEKALQLGLIMSNETSRGGELASVYLNQASSSPPIFVTQDLLSIVKTRLNLHADHLWLLQTDTSYIRRYVTIISGSNFGETLNRYFKTASAAIEMYQDAVIYWSWAALVEEIQGLLNVRSTYEGSILSGKPLPKPYVHALVSLEALLEDQIGRRAKHLNDILPDRPGFHQKWEHKQHSRLQTMAVDSKRRDDNESIFKIFSEDRLEWCLLMIANVNIDGPEETSEHTPRYDYAMFFAALEHHLIQSHKAGNKEELARVDEFLYAEVTDIAALYQLLTSLRLHQPRWVKYNSKDIKKLDTGRGWQYINKHFYAQDLRQPLRVTPSGQWGLVKEIPKADALDQKIKAQQRLAKLLDDFLNTPKASGSQVRQSWLDQDALQRVALSHLWAGMRDRHRQTLQRLEFNDHDVERDLKVLSADIHPDYISSLRNERLEIEARIARRRRDNQSAREQMAALSFGSQIPDTTSKFQPKEAKTKTKARSEPIPVEVVSPCTSTFEESPDTQAPIEVSMSKSAFGIFHSMFPSRNSEEASQKTVRWDAFVLAMAEPGIEFVARHSAGGSAVQFEPDEKSRWFGEGKIVFHKPHPVPVIDSVLLSSMGKRLRKWFGWTNKTFVLEEKK